MGARLSGVGLRAALASTLACGLFAGALSPSRPALFAAVIGLVHGRPRTAFGFSFFDAAFFVTLFNVFGFAFLFSGVTGFVATWHEELLHLGSLAPSHGVAQFLVGASAGIHKTANRVRKALKIKK